MKYNVLILSSGRRVELVNRFKKAAIELNIESEIIGADISETAPALYFCDKKVIVPKICDEGYIEAIIDVCKEYNVKLVIPTIDTELLKLAQNINKFKENNILVNLSDLNVIEICRNKINTQKWLEENNFDVPKLIDEENIKNKNYKFPLFIKPKDGSSSINAFRINNEKELNFFIEYVPNPIIQEMVFGEEYTIDVFCDFESNPITIVPRKRLATRSGEISKGLIQKNDRIIMQMKKIVEKLKPVGHITIQCIKNESKIYIIEINPRFGGGAPMTIDAGADSPKNLYKILLGEKLKYNEDYIDNIYFSRFDSSIMIKNIND